MRVTSPCSSDRKRNPVERTNILRKLYNRYNTLGGNCLVCHDERAWNPAPKFDHSRSESV